MDWFGADSIIPSAVGDRAPTLFTGSLRAMTDLSSGGEPQPGQRRRRHWGWRSKVLAGGVLTLLAVIAAIPWALATPPGQRWLLAQANRKLAPGRVAWESLHVSWFGPT